MNNKKFILLILAILLVFGILVVFVLDLNCLFKTIFGIPCPGCGLTRGFRALFHGHIITAINYNILTIPIFLFFLSIIIIIVIDIIKRNNYLEKYLYFYTKKVVVIIILLLVLISWIVNLIK